jgi:hypothetical protein
VLNTGELLAADIGRWTWQPLLPEAGHVHAVSVLSGEI